VKDLVCTLARLPVGGRGTVLDIQATGNTRRRLLDLGLVPGTVVEVIRRSPVGDPTAYKIRGAVIALREDDGEAVFVRPL
jgi:ferrous iron transport protein A